MINHACGFSNAKPLLLKITNTKNWLLGLFQIFAVQYELIELIKRIIFLLDLLDKKLF
jgi:hypothetical protein